MRLTFFLIMLPFIDSPETASGGLVRDSEHGDAEPSLAEKAAVLVQFEMRDALEGV